MHSRVRFHTSRWLLIFLCLGAFAGCSDSSDSRDTMDLREPIMLIDLLPASTRGILQLRGQGDTDPASIKQFLLSMPVHQTRLGSIAFDPTGDVGGTYSFLTDLKQELQ